MTKAAVCIGIDKTGDLPVLKDCAGGAARIAAWLGGESYDVRLLSDATAVVRARDIFEAVKDICDKGVFEQLVIYFAGHGYLNDGSEHWLLSLAPSDPNEAVSLDENVQLARDCGVPNVIFISDACRSTPQSIKADRVRGSLIFPNLGVSRTTRSDIDRFFACLPGDPAYEVGVDKSVKEYRALYTDCFTNAFVDAPAAQCRQLDGMEVLPNRALKKLLPSIVEAGARKASVALFQKPDTIVESESDIFIAKVSRRPRVATAPDLMESLRDHADGLVAEAIGAATYRGTPPVADGRLKYAIETAAKATGVDDIESRCGIVIQGVGVTEVHGIGCRAKLLEGGRETRRSFIEVEPSDGTDPTPFARTVMIRFVDGAGTAMATPNGYICSIVVDYDGDGRVPTDGVAQVTYTPSKTNWLWDGYAERREQIDQARALVAGLARKGVFRVEKWQAEAMADTMRMQRTFDPTLGLYAAYAYNDAGLLQRVKLVADVLNGVLDGRIFYDIALLLKGAVEDRRASLFPICPMLSQGWPLLRVLDGFLPPDVVDAGNYRRATLWTTFEARGMDILFNAARKGRLS